MSNHRKVRVGIDVGGTHTKAVALDNETNEIVGESIVGVVLAGVIVASVTNGGSEAPLAIVGKDFAGTAEYLGLAVFVLALLVFSKVVLGSKKA